MKALVLAAGFVVVLFIGACVVMAINSMIEEGQRRRTGTTDPRVKLLRRNHAEMARWVDDVMGDDMVRPLISETRQKEGRALLATYYDKGDMT